MQRKSKPVRYTWSAALIAACCFLSIAAVWLSWQRLTAETKVPAILPAEPSEPALDSLLELPQADDPEWEYHDLIEDKLAFTKDYLEQWGYLLLNTEADPEQRLVKLLVVPTSLNLDFIDMVIGLETELWRRHGWAFRTDYVTDEVGALIQLWTEQSEDGEMFTAADPGSSFELWVKQLAPGDQWVQGGPKLALVIDDWGYSSRYTESFLRYPFPLTVAIIPYLAESTALARQAFAGGHEVILHQPMEALGSAVELGEGGILTSMDPEEIRRRLEENIAHLPMIAGVNNHMGSKVTSDPETMAVVLETFKANDLYFLDSHTTPLSVAGAVASQVGIPYAVNSLFIDNVNEVEAVKAQLRQIINQAVRAGSAIAIGHVRSATAAAIWEMIPEIVAAGVELVPVSQLLIYPEPSPQPEEVGGTNQGAGCGLAE